MSLLQLIVLLACSIGSCMANIVEMGNFNLQELTLVNKYKFVFSDLDSDQDLDKAAIIFDLKFNP